MPERPAERHYTVTEITELIKVTLEDGFPWITVQGEISNFRPSASGHWYFSLKDTNAVLSVVMFSRRLESVKFTPEDGMLVTATGSISVYARRGNYQLICESLARTGQGDILAMLEERKRALAAQGLFDASRKRPLPLLPSRIAVVTSPTGAAIRDILRVLRRRNAGMDVVVIPTPVQGEGADEKIAHGIELAARWKLGEVIVVGRGGGSLEDLLPFSSELVVRAIAASPVPVISAVGHETDVTLSDLAADVRAPTPSAAAEMVSASSTELLGQVAGLASSLQGALQGRLERVRLLLGQFAPETLQRNVRLLLQPVLQRLDDAREGMGLGFQSRLTEARHRCEIASREVVSCSPLAVLQRGYAVVTHASTRKVLLSAQGVRTGDGLDIRLAQGRMSATVEETHAGEKL
jgi:exodeoxyribonuclease VII large subunit